MANIVSNVFYPEIWVLLIALLSLLTGLLCFKKTNIIALVSAVLLIIPMLSCCEWLWNNFEVNYQDIYAVSKYVATVKIILLLSTSCILLMMSSRMSKTDERYELPVLVLLALIGSMVMVSANNLLLFYLGLELQSLTFYILASSDRDNIKSNEAGLKYFILGALASCIILYGISLIYSFTGTINFSVLAEVYNNEIIDIMNLPIAVLIGIILLAIGMFFKISAVPFHMWTPDVFEGSPTIFTALFASVPKFAMFALMIRFFDYTVTKWQIYLMNMFVIVALVSIAVGALGAIRQSNLKRLLAYSSIGHAGFMLLGFISTGAQGLYSTFLYMIIYIIMTLGVFSCVLYIESENDTSLMVEDLAGISKNYPLVSFIMTVFMFSMAGIPPFAGFFAKFEIIRALVNSHMIITSVFCVLISVVSAFYYLNVIKVMYFDEGKKVFGCTGGTINLSIAIILGTFNLIYVFYSHSFYDMVKSLVYVQ